MDVKNRKRRTFSAHSVRYTRQAPAVLARAGLRSAAVRAKRVPLARSTICWATDSEQRSCELASLLPKKRKEVLR